MLLTELEASNFRNIRGTVVFSGDLNILLGDNGQGKTNWLESIHFLATTRSFRTIRLNEAVAFGERSAFLRGRVQTSQGLVRELRAVIEGSTKVFSVNGKRESVTRYIGQLHSVIFNADELEIIRGGPEHRRRFLDDSISAVHPPYVQTIADYARVIKQKNALLQADKEGEYRLERLAEALEPWNQQLAQHAARIHRSRVRIVERINQAAEEGLFGGDKLSIRYVSALEEKGDLENYEELIAERLRLRVQAEAASGYALIGPHRDDLEITLDGHDVRRFGSSGQQRSALLTLLLANLEIYFAQRQEYPVFLIDDIDAELDYKRIHSLLDHLRGRAQTFVTTSKESFAEEFGRGANVIRIENGSPVAEEISATAHEDL